MTDEYETRLTGFLLKHNISSFRFTHRAKHRALSVEHNGRNVTLIFPSTPSDRFGPLKSVATLRRLLDLPRPEPTPKLRKAKRKPVRKSKSISLVPAAAPATALVGQDYLAALRQIRSGMLASNENAAGLSSGQPVQQDGRWIAPIGSSLKHQEMTGSYAAKAKEFSE